MATHDVYGDKITLFPGRSRLKKASRIYRASRPIRAWKKSSCGLLIELLIPKGALIRCTSKKDKIRVSKAIVVDTSGFYELYSTKDARQTLTYSVGKTVEPVDPFDMNPLIA